MKIKPRVGWIGALLLTLSLACAFLENLGSSTAPTPLTGEVETPAPGVTPSAAAESLPPGGCPENRDKIVYTYDPRDRETVHYGIYTMNPDGSGRVRLSGPEATNHREPAWSPERCRIAFTSLSEPTNQDIYVMSADGKSIRQLTSDPARDMFPDWSPDGKQIVFVSYRAGGIRELFVMNADGSDQRQLTSNQAEYTQWVQWSPVADQIAYIFNPATPDQGGNTFVIDSSGRGVRQVTPNAGPLGDTSVAWAPDGQKLYFVSNRSHYIEIWEINLDGSGLRQITNFHSANLVDIDHSLRVSPDGQRLAFYGVGPNVEQYGTEIYLVNTDGSGLIDISLSPGQEEWLDW